ncbi:hypothetical protein ACWKTL_29030 [Bacillus toyonensis]|uniref:hypothetical protein n=1 Tax=Bacillus toyonensis TaxID=155322 RepID=UPI000B4332BF|nr:hypothetical protein [Bacillus toyonensis]MED3201660.1 hypothetical protein [Bacillus toyonensis]OTX13861.1 hypothetical protein BK712_01205 [Bacillus thuringiensis serovar seoulensis]
MGCKFDPYVTACTDSDIYGPRATSIDVTLDASDDTYGWDRTYSNNLEFYNGSSWVAVTQKTGNFKYSVTNSFSLAGLKAGSYRNRISWTCYNPLVGQWTSGSFYVPAVKVNR